MTDQHTDEDRPSGPHAAPGGEQSPASGAELTPPTNGHTEDSEVPSGMARLQWILECGCEPEIEHCGQCDGRRAKAAEHDRTEALLRNAETLRAAGWQVSDPPPPHPLRTTTDGQGSTQPADEWAHLAQLAEAATPGPWAVDDDGSCCVYANEPGAVIANVAHFDNVGTQADAAFIAAGNPAVVLTLIERLKELAGYLLATEDDVNHLHDKAADAVHHAQAMEHDRDGAIRSRNRWKYAAKANRAELANTRAERDEALRLGQALADVCAHYGVGTTALREWREWQDARQ